MFGLSVNSIMGMFPEAMDSLNAEIANIIENVEVSENEQAVVQLINKDKTIYLFLNIVNKETFNFIRQCPITLNNKSYKAVKLTDFIKNLIA